MANRCTSLIIRGCKSKDKREQVLERPWGEASPRARLVGMEIGAAILESRMEVSRGIKNKTTTGPRNSTSGDFSKENRTLSRKPICTPVFIAALFTVAKAWKQPKCPSTDDGEKKL